MGLGTDFKHLGCWRRSLPTIEETDPRISDRYRKRSEAVRKCFEVAHERGLRAFSLVGGRCGAGDDLDGYKKYGKSYNCRNHKGGLTGSDIYLILYPTGKFDTVFRKKFSAKLESGPALQRV